MSGEVNLTYGFLFQEVDPDEVVTFDSLNKLVQELMARVQQGSIANRELADGAISADKLDVYLSAQLGVADGSVTTNKLVNGAVTNPKLAEDAVTGDKIADDAIDSQHYVDGSIDPEHLSAAALAAILPQVAVFVDEKATDTNGGVAASNTWTKRTLNTSKYNGISGASLNTSTSIFTLPAGKFLVEANAPCYAGDFHKTRLVNIDDSVFYDGSSEFSDNDVQSRSHILALVDISATKTFRIDHIVANGLGGSNSLVLGVASNGGGSGSLPSTHTNWQHASAGDMKEVYTTVKITKVA